MVIGDIGAVPKAVRSAVKKKKKQLDVAQRARRKKLLREAGEKLTGRGNGQKRKKTLGESLVLDTTSPLQRLAPLFDKKKKKGPTFT